MAATYEAAPGTTRRALSAAGAVSLLVAGAYALGVVRIGADLIGESTWPVELGFDRNGDYTYPRVSEAAIGAVVVLVGVLLVVVVARGDPWLPISGSRGGGVPGCGGRRRPGQCGLGFGDSGQLRAGRLQRR
jgi:hypothetical protein